MTPMTDVTFAETDLDAIVAFDGRIAVLADGDGGIDRATRSLNTRMRVGRGAAGPIDRVVSTDGFAKMGAGDGLSISFPGGIAAEAVRVIKLDRKASATDARRAGAKLAEFAMGQPVLLLAGGHPRAADIAQGVMLRSYEFTDHKTAETTAPGPLAIACAKPDERTAEFTDLSAQAQGVFFARDLVNAPANVLTTTAFADQLVALGDLGIKVEVLDEAALADLGMGALLAVGQGSRSPSKVVVMEWPGQGGDPLALVGKGVVFDAGGISIKPAGGMEDMTMDMGGAGVVAGVMKTLALRKSTARVVGLVGLVENMPDGNALRPGDVVTSMKGDTIEVINTDAEGRLVLADVMWYAQQRFAPSAMIDLATLTGAIIIGLGHDKAGLFSNDDSLVGGILEATDEVDEGAWRLPLDPAYDQLLKSRIADMKNVGGRAAGSITAAQFLQRFVKDGLAWCHIDIAGVASVKSATAYAPAGATGWGVRALDRLIRDRFGG